jgi:hypothetical protein
MTLQQLHNLTGKILKENPYANIFHVFDSNDNRFTQVLLNYEDETVKFPTYHPIKTYQPE